MNKTTRAFVLALASAILPWTSARAALATPVTGQRIEAEIVGRATWDEMVENDARSAKAPAGVDAPKRRVQHPPFPEERRQIPPALVEPAPAAPVKAAPEVSIANPFDGRSLQQNS